MSSSKYNGFLSGSVDDNKDTICFVIDDTNIASLPHLTDNIFTYFDISTIENEKFPSFVAGISVSDVVDKEIKASYMFSGSQYRAYLALTEHSAYFDKFTGRVSNRIPSFILKNAIRLYLETKRSIRINMWFQKEKLPALSSVTDLRLLWTKDIAPLNMSKYNGCGNVQMSNALTMQAKYDSKVEYYNLSADLTGSMFDSPSVASNVKTLQPGRNCKNPDIERLVHQIIICEPNLDLSQVFSVDSAQLVLDGKVIMEKTVRDMVMFDKIAAGHPINRFPVFTMSLSAWNETQGLVLTPTSNLQLLVKLKALVDVAATQVQSKQQLLHAWVVYS